MELSCEYVTQRERGIRRSGIVGWALDDGRMLITTCMESDVSHALVARIILKRGDNQGGT